MGERALIPRPTEYDEKFLDMLSGGELIGTALKTIGYSRSTLCRWRINDPEFDNRCSRALNAGLESIFEQIVTIPDTYEDVNRARIKIEAIKIYASKMNPAKYGDRLDLNVTTTIDLSEALKQAALRSRQVFELPSYTLNEATDLQAVASSEIQSATNMELLEDLI